MSHSLSSPRQREADWLAAALALCVLVVPPAAVLWPKALTAVLLATGAPVILAAGWSVRGLPRPVGAIAAPLAAVLVWAGCSVLWSPFAAVVGEAWARTASGGLLVILLFNRPLAALDAPQCRLVLRALGLGVGVLGVALALELLADAPLYRTLRGVEGSNEEVLTRLNRALTYLAVLIWPAAAWIACAGRTPARMAAWRWRPRAAALAVLGVLTLTGRGYSNAATLAVLAGAGAWGLAHMAGPRVVRRLLVGGVVAAGLAGPLLAGLTVERWAGETALSVPVRHRLEIYEFGGRRVLDRPLLGWGLGTTRHLPVAAEEIAHYRVFDRPPTHPHNHWLEAWLELGAPGWLLVTLLTLTVIGRTRRLPDTVQPFALASCAATLVIGTVSYSLWSGSWIVALTIAGLAFFVWPRPQPQDGRAAAAAPHAEPAAPHAEPTAPHAEPAAMEALALDQPPRGAAAPTLTAVVVAHNEAARLDGCLAALAFADERLVVLDRCTDDSAAIAARHRCRMLEGAWPRECDRRHAGLEAAGGDWLLEIDADERVTPALAAEIRDTITGSTAGHHAVPVLNHLGSRPVRYGWGASFGTGAKMILFRRGTKTWGPQRVHPDVRFSGQKGARLETPLLHFVDDDVTDMLARLNRYTSLRAADLRDAGLVWNGKRESLARNLGRLVTRFYKCYIRRHGYREGALGVLIALLAGLFPLLSYLKARIDEHRPAG